MDYRKTAQDILDHVGGSKNIASAAHCATRLRLVIADNKKVSKEALENVDGVKGVFEASGQLQIILGTGTVNNHGKLESRGKRGSCREAELVHACDQAAW